MWRGRTKSIFGSWRTSFSNTWFAIQIFAPFFGMTQFSVGKQVNFLVFVCVSNLLFLLESWGLQGTYQVFLQNYVSWRWYFTSNFKLFWAMFVFNFLWKEILVFTAMNFQFCALIWRVFQWFDKNRQNAMVSLLQKASHFNLTTFFKQSWC